MFTAKDKNRKYFTLFSSVSIADFEQTNISWVNILLISLIFFSCNILSSGMWGCLGQLKKKFKSFLIRV